MPVTHVLPKPVADELSRLYKPLRGRRSVDIRRSEQDWARWNRTMSYVHYMIEVGWSKSSIAKVLGIAPSAMWEFVRRDYEPVNVDDLPDWQPDSPETRGRPARPF